MKSISQWGFLRRSRAAYSIVGSRIWPNFELVRELMHVSVYKKDLSLPTTKEVYLLKAYT